mmetsp:Transcript_28427/g.21234  ORF Transcript_28427/g.21234 Transcript_28427/m.21234 type:complete len:201 (+) Transcript_28427:27-629(+)
MRIEKCYFCSSNVYPGHGVMFVRNDSKTFRFCSSKCNKLFKGKKNPRKLRWTKAYRAAHGKEMTVDPVLEFEQRRNVPTRYNRELMVKTIQAMKKIDEIRTRRQQRFFDRRMAKAKAKKKADMERELMTHSDLITDPKVKDYIQAKKAQLEEEKQANVGQPEQREMNVDVDMMEESSEEEQPVKIPAKLQRAKKSKGIKK